MTKLDFTNLQRLERNANEIKRDAKDAIDCIAKIRRDEDNITSQLEDSKNRHTLLQLALDSAFALLDHDDHDVSNIRNLHASAVACRSDVRDLTSKRADITKIITMTEASNAGSNALRADAILASHIPPSPPLCLTREDLCMKEANGALAKHMAHVVTFYEDFDSNDTLPPSVARKSATPPSIA
jgi:hypothetical protein